MRTDSELLSQYVTSGSESAFAELAERYVNLIYSAALRQVHGDAYLARDVTQSVFTDLARKATGLRNRATLEGWLYTSTHYAAAKMRRTELRRKTRERDAFEMNAANAAAITDEEWTRLRPVIDDAMHELNERERETVLLRFFEKLPLADVGQKLGMTENAASKNVERALEKLRTLLSRRGITSTSGALAVILTGQAIAAAPAGLAGSVVGPAIASAGSGATVALLSQIMHLLKPGYIAAAALVSAGTVYYGVRANSNDASIGATPMPPVAPAPLQAPAAPPASPPKTPPADGPTSSNSGMILQDANTMVGPIRAPDADLETAIGILKLITGRDPVTSSDIPTGQTYVFRFGINLPQMTRAQALDNIVPLFSQKGLGIVISGPRSLAIVLQPDTGAPQLRLPGSPSRNSK